MPPVKVQDQEVMLPVERLVKLTTIGGHPVSGVAEKFAVTCAVARLPKPISNKRSNAFLIGDRA